MKKRSQQFFLMMCAVVAFAANADPNPDWAAPRQHRVLVTVDPVELGDRKQDELVSWLEFDRAGLGLPRPDLSTMCVIQYDPSTGKPMDRKSNAYATVPGELPFQFYDEQVPWEFPGMEGYVDVEKGTALPRQLGQGTGRFFGSIGQGNKGQIAWPHTQDGSNASCYAIYYDALPEGVAPRAPIPGFLGDGINRCTKQPTTFAPVIHGRVAVGDLSGDGLFDMVLGNATGTVLYYQNSGTPGKPRFEAAQLLTMEDGSPLDVGWSSAPFLVDWDKDGLLDLITGAEKEAILFFKNVGSKESPKFKLMGPVLTDGKPLRTPHSPCAEDPENKTYPVDYYPIPQVVDWNGDGRLDLLAGGYITGLIYYYENTASSADKVPQLAYKGIIQADGANLDTTWCAAPCAADFNGDGQLDMLSGSMQITAGGGDLSSAEKFLMYYESQGTTAKPNLVHRPFPAKGSYGSGALATPRAIDVDGDGLLDLVISCGGDVWIAKNIGSKTAPVWDATTPALRLPYGNTALGWVCFVDQNGDGWPDLFNGREIRINDGKGAPGIFSKRVPISGAEKIDHPEARGDKWDYRIYADLNGDAKRDILIGDTEGFVWYHRNTGTADRPEVDVRGVKLKTKNDTEVKVGIAPANAAAFDVLQGARTTLTAMDVNHDGRLDLVVGDTYGKVRLFLQTSTSDEVPLFEPPVEIPGPVQKVRLVVQRIDWNRDGWDDLLLAYASNAFFILLNEPTGNGRQFGTPQEIKIPGCWGDPFATVTDWNHDGDEDLIIDQYGHARFVEQSFIRHGHVPAKVVGHETRNK
jgi:hypothetical protein